MKKSRPVVDIVKFIKVVKDRAMYPDAVSASAALGMTLNSFKQKLVRERKRYPKVFDEIEGYEDGRQGRLLSEDELLDRLSMAEELVS
jgi:hypothetical protein